MKLAVLLKNTKQDKGNFTAHFKEDTKHGF
ncbi:hypothetical protein M2372_004454 [Chryseobacterium sp. BIGb0232]|nr:hypothetical protein [Chryseobacterium sp. BIGb0232]ROS08217.1 hypothetical protein EDF65_4666 [Chryseobacterium nakagawai]